MSKSAKLKYALYTMTHPLDGFYEIRHRNKGSIYLSILFVILFSFSFSMNKQYASFIVSDFNPYWSNSISDFIAVFMFYILFSISNWSVTCLMNGEGRLKDIVTMAGYSTLPLIFTLIPATILSRLIAANEEAFYVLIIGVANLWFIYLAVIGIMTIHNYTFGKTLITIFLTFVAMAIIIFVSLLLVSLVQQVFLFIQSIYTELVFSI